MEPNLHFGVLILLLLSLRQAYHANCKVKEKDEMPLSTFIHHFEPLNYDLGPLAVQQRNRIEQSSHDGVINWEIAAFERSFHLQLAPYPNVITQGAQLNVVNELETSTTDLVSQLYKGIVIGDKHSSAHGHIINGMFDGIIKTDGEIYHIEPSFRYFTSPKPEFHSVIYRAGDVHLQDPPIANHSDSCQLCSVSWDGTKVSSPKMYSLRRHKVPGKRDVIFPDVSPYDERGRSKLPIAPSDTQLNVEIFQQSLSKPDWLQAAQANVLHQLESSTYDAGHLEEHSNSSSSEQLTNFDRASKTCVLHIVVDHTFFEHVAGGDTMMAVAEVAYHIEQANSAYRATDFDGDGVADNIGLAIGGMTIFESSAAQDYLISGDYQDAEEFLTDLSLYNFSAYCMGLAFTYRDFTGGVLGLAWMGYPDFGEPPGGICQGQLIYRNDGRPSSLNTAMVTLVNYDSYVPRSVSVTSVMHELGHGFGSPHDPQTLSCSPSGLQGNYIMYSQATDGNRPNNARFSSCSRGQMAAVIATKGALCLEAHSGQYCGNGLVEPGEECDCGTASLCALADECCTPKGGVGSDGECTLRRQLGRVCSPLTSPCCDNDCQIIPASMHKHCNTDNECLFATYCNGSSADCPQPVPRPDGSQCEDGAQRCRHGQCVLSACADLDVPECFCSDVNGTGRSCQLCCGLDGNCTPAVELGLTTSAGNVIRKQPGSACDNYTGYCDLQGLCVTTDHESALNKLKNIFKDGMLPINWINTNWFYIACGVLCLCFLCLSAKLTYDHRRYLQTGMVTGMVTGLVRMCHLRIPRGHTTASLQTGATVDHGLSFIEPASEDTTAAGNQFLVLGTLNQASPSETRV